MKKGTWMKSSNGMGKKWTRRNVLAGATAGAALALPLSSTTAFASPQQQSQTNVQDEGLLSGKQYRIQSGNTYAVVTEEGAGLREFVVNGREMLDTFGPNEISPNTNGQGLIPFPNRIDQGAYTFQGVEQQLPLSEPANDNAIHGLTRWLNWSVAASGSDYVQLAIVLHGQAGYPFVLAVKETYRVTSGVLTITTDATNIGTAALPYGVGHHPYISLGIDPVDPAILLVPANSYFKTNSRLIPEPPAVTVAGTEYDFRTPRAIGTTVMDIGFANLIYDSDGYARVKFTAPSGKPAVTVFADKQHKYFQLYTGDSLTVPAERRRSLAIESYSCAANAFNNGLGLVVLNPGQSFSSTWGISVVL
jgi:aldose 1-epimerase